jgi:uncharacterized RmlC-like cupin family protein
MAEYLVILKDSDGFDICSDLVDGMSAAKARANFLLSDRNAHYMGTTHATLGTDRVEVHLSARPGDVLWNAFRKGI